MNNILLQVDTAHVANSALSLSLSDCKDIATIVGVVIACGTLIKGLLEYISQGKQKRAEYYFYLRKRLKENEAFNNIFHLVDKDATELSEISLNDRKEFLGLFQEVALLKKAGLIKKELSYYMFGYFAIRCLDSENFWHGLNKDDHYWTLFMEFAKEAKKKKHEILLYTIDTM